MELQTAKCNPHCGKMIIFKTVIKKYPINKGFSSTLLTNPRKILKKMCLFNVKKRKETHHTVTGVKRPASALLL